MSKKGKIILAVLVFGFLLGSPLAAQEWTKSSLQNLYMDYLRIEGYTPSLTSNGDVLFKIAGENYVIEVSNDDLQYFSVYYGLNLRNVTYTDALYAANYASMRSKVAKLWIDTSDGLTVWVEVQILLNNPRDFSTHFSRIVSILRNAISNFESQI